MRILHTMLRVGDLERSITFYTNVLGMQLLRRKDYLAGEFTLAFIGYGDETDQTVLELTYNWGVTSTNWARLSGISRWKCRMCTPPATKCGQRAARSSAKPGR